MKLTTWIPLALAIVLGLAAAFVARGVLAKRRGGNELTDQIKVVIVKQTVPPGGRIGPLDVGVGAVTGEQPPEGAFVDPNQLVGRVAVSPLVKGQVVLESLLAAQGADAGVQNLVPEGMRLITIEVNEFSSLAGMLAPGCRVDILAALSDPETKEMLARTIVENVKVTAVGQRVGPAGAEESKDGPPAEAGFRSVTLLVAPKEAEAIHVASTAGRPWMVLRGNADNVSVESPGVSLAELRTNARGMNSRGFAEAMAALNPKRGSTTQPSTTQPFVNFPNAKPAKRETRTVTFIKGGKVETITVDAAPAADELITSSEIEKSATGQ